MKIVHQPDVFASVGERNEVIRIPIVGTIHRIAMMATTVLTSQPALPVPPSVWPTPAPPPLRASRDRLAGGVELGSGVGNHGVRHRAASSALKCRTW